MNSTRRYLPIAIPAVVMLAVFLVGNPSIVFNLLNPSQMVKGMEHESTQQLGERDEPLTFQEANQLYQQFKKNDRSRADLALVRQDKRNGLPPRFISQLENEFVRAKYPENQHARALLLQLAAHRELPIAVERNAGGDLLTQIATHRQLEDATLKRLLEPTNYQALDDSLSVLISVADSQELPGWTIPELERIARERRGSARSKAIEAIAVSGHHARAQALIQTLTDHPLAAEAIAAAIGTDSPPELVQLLKDPSRATDLRVGALERLARAHEHPEVAGAGFSYAFQQDGRLLETAYLNFRKYGAQYTSHIDVDWVPLLDQHFDGPRSLRFKVADKFRFLAVGDAEQRSAFLLRMLHGSDRQQHTAMLALSPHRDVSDEAHERMVALRNSAHADVNHMANVYLSRVKRNSVTERAKRATLGILFWLAFALPVLAGLGWQAWFVATLLSRLSSGEKRTAMTFVCIFWLFLCIVLGAGLFLFLLGYGHDGGGIESDVIGVLAALGLVVWGLGWIVHRVVRGSSLVI